jgi:anti-sigma B factor antagonist
VTVARRTDEEARVVVEGDVDLSGTPEITRCLEELVESGCTRLTLDLAGVTFADANALGLLVRTKRKLEKQDGTLEVFYDDNPYVTRLLDVTGLASLFR